MTNSITLLRDGAPLAERVLHDCALELGSAAGCDLLVPELPPRAFLVQAQGGTVRLFDLAQARLEGRVLALERPFAIGDRYSLVRHQQPLATADGATTPLLDAREALPQLSLLVGSGADARRVRVGERPLRVGSGYRNELVLHDPTVSAEHCRFEPSGSSLLVRDLGSRNGTFVQGVRVDRARLRAGVRLRVGRTDLRLVAHEEPGGLVVASAAMQDVFAEARRFAELPWPVLVLGPSGVGKEELAGLLHREGPRARGPFVALNAGGLPRELVESELFGHEKGAYTGAHAQRRGVFEQADGGTLFLDEIGELPLALQSRLLRVLETWTIRRVGSESELPVDVRLVCATHRDLAQMVQEGSFRQDLYYRLANLVLQVAALRERPEDVLALARHFVASFARELGGRKLSAAAEERLLAHPWPGNARELKNVLRAAAALSPSPELDLADIEGALARVSAPLARVLPDAPSMERTLARYGGNLSAASRALNVPRSTLRDRLKKR
ncbi:MAG TPA: sigma 54-interacting transcriptional regulator [Polyangiales bacterium]|nr:sigma 54-interacting transcriptional regulator [Polyangiales bacterium]